MNTRDVARFVTGLRYEDLPREVVDQAKLSVRDTLAVALASHDSRAVRAAAKFAVEYLSGPQQATILGTRTKVPCATATLVNAVMASNLDMGDAFLLKLGDEGPRGHAGYGVVPASLSIAEWQEIDGRRFLEAVVIGYEVTISVSTVKWFSGARAAAGTVDAYGATAVAAKLLGLNEEQTIDALGICEAHCPRPPRETITHAMAMTKEVFGWGPMTGVASALLAKAGFQGPPSVFDLAEHGGKPIPNLGEDWGIMSNHFKTYPACYNCHVALDGVLELVGKHSLKASDIAAVCVEVSPSSQRILGNPRPANTRQAQHSIPFAIGAAIVDGEFGLEQIAEERLTEPAILNIAEKVQVIGDENMARIPYFGDLATRVSIDTVQGQRFETFIATPRGMFENALTRDELERKFTKLAAKVLGAGRAQSLNDLIMTLERLQSVKDLVEGATVEVERRGGPDSNWEV